MRPKSPTIYNTGHKSHSKYSENCIGGGGFHSPVKVTASKEALIFPTESINQGRASTRAGHQPRPLWYGRGPFPREEGGGACRGLGSSWLRRGRLVRRPGQMPRSPNGVSASLPAEPLDADPDTLRAGARGFTGCLSAVRP